MKQSQTGFVLLGLISGVQGDRFDGKFFVSFGRDRFSFGYIQMIFSASEALMISCKLLELQLP